MYQVCSKTIEVFTCRVGIPIKARYCIAVVPYALMKCCPVSARMRDAGSPFLLESYEVFSMHKPFISSRDRGSEFILDKFREVIP
jgi:hypothetical protein